MKYITQNIKAIILGIILAGGLSYAFAWSGPTATPPGNNVTAPINIGYNSQSKLGQLFVNTSTSSPYAIGLLAFGESVFDSNSSGTPAVQINDGTAHAGYVLTSTDSNGTAKWQSAASGPSVHFITPVYLENVGSGNGTTTVNLQADGVPSTASAVIIQAEGFVNESDKGGSSGGGAPYMEIVSSSGALYQFLLQQAGSTNLRTSNEGIYPIIVSGGQATVKYYISTGWNNYTVEVLGYLN